MRGGTAAFYLLTGVIAMSAPSRADTIQLYAAGSLRAALTPKADPSGDYALEVFAKAESIRPGARAALEKKAAQLTGSADSAQPPAGRNAYGWHVGEGRADIFLAYCTA